MIEVERKYRIGEGAAIAELIERVTDLPDGVRQVDTIYLQDATSFADVDRSRGYAVLRVREVNGRSFITVKRRRTGSSAIEAEVETDAATAAAFMEALQWNIVTQVAKVRREAQLKGVTLALDEVEGLGIFVELEVLVESGANEEEALGMIDRVARLIGLKDEWVEQRKYDELLSP